MNDETTLESVLLRQLLQHSTLVIRHHLAECFYSEGVAHLAKHPDVLQVLRKYVRRVHPGAGLEVLPASIETIEDRVQKLEELIQAVKGRVA